MTAWSCHFDRPRRRGGLHMHVRRIIFPRLLGDISLCMKKTCVGFSASFVMQVMQMVISHWSLVIGPLLPGSLAASNETPVHMQRSGRGGEIFMLRYWPWRRR